MAGDRLAGLMLGDMMVVDECAESTAQDDECVRYRITVGHRQVGKLTAGELEHLGRAFGELAAARARRTK